MKKHYCNKCEVEITSQNAFSKLEVDVAGVKFITEMENAIPIDYDVCKSCVFDAIAAEAIRPMTA
jgi:hypothetical protein